MDRYTTLPAAMLLPPFALIVVSLAFWSRR